MTSNKRCELLLLIQYPLKYVYTANHKQHVVLIPKSLPVELNALHTVDVRCKRRLCVLFTLKYKKRNNEDIALVRLWINIT